MTTRFLAGAAETDLTPRLGTQIAGDIGRYRPAEFLLDPLFARALVLESAGRRLCVLSLDLLAVTRPWVTEIRRRAEAEFGLRPEQVMVHSTQTHAAPTVGHCAVSDECTLIPPDLPWLRGGDDAYNEFAVGRIIEALRRACESLEPVRFGAASGLEGRVAQNRRYVMRDGTTLTHPSGDRLKDVLYCEGPIDPEVGLVAFVTESLHTRAALLQYTCHPTHGYPLRYISAGWPGAWVNGFKGLHGAECVPLVINGCCGNIHHSHHLDPTFPSTPEHIGRLLTDDVVRLFSEIRWSDEAPLDCRSITLKLPIRSLTPEAVAAAEQMVRDHPEPLWANDERTAVAWDWVYAVSSLDIHAQQQKQPWQEYEIQVFRFGDIALVGLGGEPFVEGQLQIKQHSPVRHTYFAHMTNGFVGYIPTEEAFRRGGYETRTANWSQLAPEALGIIAEETAKLLGGLFA